MAEHTPRRDRHRIAVVAPRPAPPAVAEDIEAGTIARPAPRRRAVVSAGTGLYAPTPGSVIRRPAQLSDRCTGCGAPTRGRETMLTEFVEVGPVRALRVVSCSACPDKRPAEDCPGPHVAGPSDPRSGAGGGVTSSDVPS